MKIYNYDEQTGELLSESIARENPLEQGEYLVPANATEINPLASKQDNRVVFNGIEWEYEEIKTFYKYDEETFEYKGEMKSFNEVEYATTKEPMVSQEGFVTVFKDGEWVSIEDIRGTWYNIREEVEVTSLNHDMDGLTKEPIPYTAEELEAQRVSQIREKANEIISAKYPDYKQRNGAMGVYGDNYYEEMKAFISGIVEQSNTLEADSTKTADDFVV